VSGEDGEAPTSATDDSGDEFAPGVWVLLCPEADVQNPLYEVVLSDEDDGSSYSGDVTVASGDRDAMDWLAESIRAWVDRRVAAAVTASCDDLLRALARCEALAMDECASDAHARADIADTAADAYAPHSERVRELVGTPLPEHVRSGFRADLATATGLHAIEVARLTAERDAARALVAELGASDVPCRCGSGGHPRACPRHPHVLDLHVAELNVCVLRDTVGDLKAERDALRDAAERALLAPVGNGRPTP